MISNDVRKISISQILTWTFEHFNNFKHQNSDSFSPECGCSIGQINRNECEND